MKDVSLCVREKKMEKLNETAAWPGKKKRNDSSKLKE